MKCLSCKGELHDEYTNFIADLGECIIVVRNVPTQVCAQCGEKSYSYSVSVRIQEIVNQVRSLVAGIAEVNYSEAA